MGGTNRTLLEKIVGGLRRDTDLTWSERLVRGTHLVEDTVSARVQLRACTRVAPGARVRGRVRVHNEGSICIGGGLSITGRFLPVELVASHGATLGLGDDVWINFGTLIAARKQVLIGSNCRFGQHCIISDSDEPDPGLGAEHRGVAAARPIHIGDGAWLAGRVTVRPGVTVGAGSVITAGSIVETDIPPGVIAGGIPARVLRPLSGSAAGVAATVENRPLTTPPSEPAPRPAPKHYGVLVSDFTVDELAEELAAAGPSPVLGTQVAPFGQVTQTLMGEAEQGASDFLVVWVKPESIAPSFASVTALERPAPDQLLAEVDAFCSLVRRAATQRRAVFLPLPTSPAWRRGLGLADLRSGGVARALLEMRHRMAQVLEATPNVYLLDADRWLHTVGYRAEIERGWFLGKLAMPRNVMREAALDIRAAWAALHGGMRKLLVLDLDDTLWGGIVGDVGWEGLQLGRVDAEGEAHVEFQRAVKALKNRGVVLAIASKNEESVALTAIREHPEMVLREDDFVAHRINWQDKAQNISAIAQELNLGLQSVVFIDDNPVERARVREALPEVLVPEWPRDKAQYVAALHRLTCFDTPSVSEEDLVRTRMYQEERKREVLQQELGSIDEWLESLQMRVSAEPLGPGNLGRATQLLNKTNQLNLSTRRLTEQELMAFAQAPSNRFWVVSVADRFGDAGITGLVSITLEADGSARIVDYILSCRVMGRRVEETMVHIAVTAARGKASTLTAELIPTSKNKPCLTFWQRSGFEVEGEHVFRWNLADDYALPKAIQLSWRRE